MTTPICPAPATNVAPEAPVAATRRSQVLIWAALFAMALTSFSLITAEFLPGGLLTTMAAALGVSAGAAGQTVTVTALIGFLTALTIGILAGGLDRRTLLVGLALAAALSNAIVAIAPSLWLLLIARMLLGAAISGFWAMSLTIASRIGGPDHVARSMMFVNAGTTMATVLGVPLGVYMANVVSWRTVFLAAAVLTVLVAFALRVLLPSVPAEPGAGLAILRDTLRRPGVSRALTGHVLTVLGHMAAYAFIRVALEEMPEGDRLAPSLLLVFGVGGMIGNFGIGMIADRHLGALRFAVPGLIAAAVLTVAVAPGSVPIMVLAVLAWGVGFGGWLIVLNTWAGRYLPDRLEASGGLIVAGFQLAIMLGAGLGGVLVETAGIQALLLLASLIAVVGMICFGTVKANLSSQPVRE